MESIFNYIYLNIQKNGKLKDNFTLDEYRANTETNLNFEDGAEDGIIITHGTSKPSKKIINELLNISEDLKKYVDPKVLIRDEDDNQNIDLFSEKLDDLFEYKVISRGINYFKEDMICSSIHYNNKYITYVQGSDFETEYEVEIEMKGTTIKKMKCNCPYEGNCKHQYASILYLREKLK